MRRQSDCGSTLARHPEIRAKPAPGPPRLLICLLFLASAFSGAENAAPACKVIDLMPQFWQSIDESDASIRLRTLLLEPYPDLYNENYINLPTGAKWDSTVAREQIYAAAHRREIDAAERYLSANAKPLMSQFQQAFPDFKCDFTFYIAPSFGQMDGSAACMDNIESSSRPTSLRGLTICRGQRC